MLVVEELYNWEGKYVVCDCDSDWNCYLYERVVDFCLDKEVDWKSCNKVDISGCLSNSGCNIE